MSIVEAPQAAAFAPQQPAPPLTPTPCLRGGGLARGLDKGWLSCGHECGQGAGLRERRTQGPDMAQLPPLPCARPFQGTISRPA